MTIIRRLRPALLALLALSLSPVVLLPLPASAATTAPAMGASTPDNAAFSTLEKSAGPLRARRTYNGSLPKSFAASLAASDVAAGRTSYWSFKPNVKTFANDSAAQSAFSSFLDTIPKGHQTVVIAWHEPEDNIAKGEFTLAQWGATNNKLGQIIDSKKRPEIRLGITLMGPWTFDSRSSYYSYKWESVLNFSLVDVVGIDPYKFRTSDPSLQSILTVSNSGAGGTTASTMQRLKTWGKPVVLAEWGVVDTDVKTGASISDSTRATWISSAYSWMKSWNAANSVKIEAALYFDHDVSTGDTKLRGQALTAFSTAAADSRR